MKVKFKLNKNSEAYKNLLDEFFLPKDVTQVQLIDALVSRLVNLDTSIDVDKMKLTTTYYLIKEKKNV